MLKGLHPLYERYFEIDVQFDGADQHDVFIMAEKCFPQMGYVKKIYLMSPMG